MTILILITFLCLVLLIAGFAGCIIPGLPGPPLAFSSLIIISLYSSWTSYSGFILLLMAGLTAMSMLFDYVLPVVSAKKAGAHKSAIWGCITGMILGLIFFPPFGPIIGAFLGALIFELIFNPSNTKPFQSAIAVLWGTFLSAIFKLSITGVIAYYAVSGLIKLY